MTKFPLTLVAVAVLMTAPAFASGGGGGGGGGYGGYSGGGSFEPRQVDPRAAAYGRGQSMVKKHITCKKCPYQAGIKDSKTALEVATKVKRGEFDLKPEQRQAVLYFLAERFSITV